MNLVTAVSSVPVGSVRRSLRVKRRKLQILLITNLVNILPHLIISICCRPCIVDGLRFGLRLVKKLDKLTTGSNCLCRPVIFPI